MTGTEPVKLTLAGQEYSLRFTLPRLREMNSRTGKGTSQLLSEAIGLNFDALLWLLWAAIAHPENPTLKSKSPEQIMVMLDLKDTGNYLDVLSQVLDGSFEKRAEPGEPEDPQSPAPIQ